ncbi:MAG: 3TM-type holin [Pseudomonadota bacterium]
MGLISGIMGFLFGDGRNVLAETAEVFRENTEKSAIRAADARADSLAQFAAEFRLPRKGLFDRFVDALNRLPRPALALGTIWLFVMAMYQPDRFADGMAGLAQVPEPLWWLMGAIVSFYFGARHQAKAQDFQRSLALGVATRQHAPKAEPENPALAEWQASDGG